MPFDSPTIDWPRETRGAGRFNESLVVGNALGDDVGRAYLYAALLVEHELHSEHNGSPLYDAAEGFLVALRQLAGMPN